jgi:rod shape-determining protein MreD
VVLQLVVAPAITLFGVVPNFILATVIITAIHNGPVRSVVMGFVLGLVFDFCSLGPLGAMTLVLTILSYAVSSLNKGVFTGGIVVDMIILLAALIAGEFLISVIYAIVGANPEFLLSLVQRVLPAIAYDALIGLILMIIYNAIVGDSSFRSGGGTGRSLTRKLHL